MKRQSIAIISLIVLNVALDVSADYTEICSNHKKESCSAFINEICDNREILHSDGDRRAYIYSDCLAVKQGELLKKFEAFKTSVDERIDSLVKETVSNLGKEIDDNSREIERIDKDIQGEKSRITATQTQFSDLEKNIWFEVFSGISDYPEYKGLSINRHTFLSSHTLKINENSSESFKVPGGFVGHVYLAGPREKQFKIFFLGADENGKILLQGTHLYTDNAKPFVVVQIDKELWQIQKIHKESNHDTIRISLVGLIQDLPPLAIKQPEATWNCEIRPDDGLKIRNRAGTVITQLRKGDNLPACWEIFDIPPGLSEKVDIKKHPRWGTFWITEGLLPNVSPQQAYFWWNAAQPKDYIRPDLN